MVNPVWTRGSAFEKRIRSTFGRRAGAQRLFGAHDLRFKRCNSRIEFVRRHGGKVLAQTDFGLWFSRREFVKIDSHDGLPCSLFYSWHNQFAEQESLTMALPKTMAAIAIERTAAGPRLFIKNMLVPHPGPGQILIKVAAAGVNHADLLQVEGHHPPPAGAPETPGLEASGTAVALDQAVTGIREGDEVCVLLPGGGYAEYAVASALCALSVPKGARLTDAGGLPEVYFTVWSNVFDTARLKTGETFLVHGGSSGIGTAAIQLLHARGHRVYATAGSAEKCAACVRLGATRAINYKTEDFVALVKEETNGRGVDVILDMVGGDYVMRNLHTLARGGRLVNIAYQKGAKVQVDFRLVQARLLSLSATGLRGRPDSEKALVRDHLTREVWPLFEAGRLKTVTDRTLPLGEAAAAHQIMRDGRHIGKILLIP